jgi:hypothetical protein
MKKDEKEESWARELNFPLRQNYMHCKASSCCFPTVIKSIKHSLILQIEG